MFEKFCLKVPPQKKITGIAVVIKVSPVKIPSDPSDSYKISLRSCTPQLPLEPERLLIVLFNLRVQNFFLHIAIFIGIPKKYDYAILKKIRFNGACRGRSTSDGYFSALKRSYLEFYSILSGLVAKILFVNCTFKVKIYFIYTPRNASRRYCYKSPITAIHTPFISC